MNAQGNVIPFPAAGQGRPATFRDEVVDALESAIEHANIGEPGGLFLVLIDNKGRAIQRTSIMLDGPPPV